MMMVLKSKYFVEWAEDEGLTEKQLRKALKEITSVLIDANLGSGLFKKRLARQGQGKRGGYRILLAFKAEDRLIFLWGFSKNEQSNISDDELGCFKALAKSYLTASNGELQQLIADGDLEVMQNEQND